MGALAAIDLPPRPLELEASAAAVDVEIVIPVYNEKRVLEGSIRRLHVFLTQRLPFSWRIVIADDGSTDGTDAVARRLSYELPAVVLLRLRAKGRGRALRAACSISRAEVLCCMDVDLSTDLGCLLPLVASLIAAQRRGLRIHELRTPSPGRAILGP